LVNKHCLYNETSSLIMHLV